MSASVRNLRRPKRKRFERHWEIFETVCTVERARKHVLLSMSMVDDVVCDSMPFPPAFITAINVKVMETNTATEKENEPP